MVTAIYTANTIRQNRRLDVIADIISENGGGFPEPKYILVSDSKELPDFINTETPFTTRFYTVTLVKDNSFQSADTSFVSDVSETDAKMNAEEVLQKGRERGWYNNFRYKIYEADGVKHIIFISGKNHRNLSNDFMKSTVKIFGIGSIAVLGLKVLFS